MIQAGYGRGRRRWKPPLKVVQMITPALKQLMMQPAPVVRAGIRALQARRNIGIIGSGHIGSTLARHLAALGHQVSIANSRGPASLVALAADIGVIAATVEQATCARDMVIIAVPEKAVWQLPREITSAVVVDAVGRPIEARRPVHRHNDLFGV